MSSVVPPTPQPPPQVLTLPRATVLAAPSSLAELAIGTRLDVIVSTMPEGNQLLLDTPLGPVTLSLPFKPVVAPSQPLMLHLLGFVGKGGGQPKVALSLPDGKPLTGTPLTPPRAGAAAFGTAQGSTATVPAAPRLGVGITIGATLIRPLVLTPQGQVQTSTTPAGTATSALPGAASAALPGTQPPTPGTGAPATGQNNVAPGRAPAGAPRAPGTPASPPQAPTIVPAGSGLLLKIVSVVPPQGQTPSLTPPPTGSPVSLAPGATLTGVVSGQQGPTAAVVQTHAGPIVIPTDRPLVPGTQFTFELVALRPAAPADPASHLVASSPLDSGTWPALADSLDALADVAPGAQAHLLQGALPRADAQLTANVMFFLSAIRGGDVKAWIGDGPLRILERQRPDLAARLKDDIGQSSRRVSDPETGEWRQIAVPFLHDGEIDRIVLLSRDPDGRDDDEETPGGTRFVVDLNLSRLGHLQIDGLVGAKGRRLDVVVRTDQPLTGDMRQDIRTLYANALEVTGLDGSVGFQAAPGNFVKVAARAAAKIENTVV